MKAQRLDGWQPMVTAFAVWFVHFMLCWMAVEIWPRQWAANVVAWGATVLAVLILVVHLLRLQNSGARGPLAAWNRRLGRGATAIAGVAVLFGALPSLVFLP